ncbi:hypothetical protein CDAR_409411 [Caerostris darwini]|uniref:Uncharacterized protein n=1 Tax=Caerostris darwini TaxID=1538125 RepID=A0AAV4S336_9ARAC|nr:hypothetical protein CDAR_409411 [Caerostris darwini]
MLGISKRRWLSLIGMPFHKANSIGVQSSTETFQSTRDGCRINSIHQSGYVVSSIHHSGSMVSSIHHSRSMVSSIHSDLWYHPSICIHGSIYTAIWNSNSINLSLLIHDSADLSLVLICWYHEEVHPQQREVDLSCDSSHHSAV